jgi:Cu(I)/Ag(I) efflux system membrane protein CusA/SilA
MNPSSPTPPLSPSPPHESPIERIIEWSARNRFLVFAMTIALFLAGIYCAKKTPLDAIPDLSDVQVIVFTQWEGRSPNLVEDQITYPIVTKLVSAPKVRVARGYSFFGYSFVYAVFEDGTDIYWARSRVLEYMAGLTGNLPPGVTPTLGPDATGVGWGFQYALVDKSGNNDLAQLRSFQDWHLRYWLQSIEGVSEVATFGGFEKQYQVEIDPNKLVAYNIPISRVVSAIRSANNDVGGRELERFGTTYLVRGKGYIQSLEDLRLVVVGSDAKGTPVLVRDVAKNVTVGPEMRRGAGDFNGEGETVGGIVVVRYGQNVLQVIERIKERLEEIKPSLPEGVEIVTTYDRSDLINRSIQTLWHTITEESIIVAVIIIIFLLDFGGAVRAIVTLPIAVVLAFIPMYFLGITANIMSLAGIAISIGVLTDEAVAMVENVHKRLEHAPPGLNRRQRQEIIISACKQLGKPLFFALLVITVSFMPVFTLEAQEGRLFKPLAYTKTFTMAWAAFLSITLGPALIVLMTGAKVIPEHRHPISRILHRLYYPWVNALMRRRFLSIAIALIAVGSSVPVYFKLGSEFMPPLNEGTILYMPTTLPTISITEATRVLQLQDKIFKQFPEVVTVHGKAGRAETATDPAPMEMFETVVQLKPESEWRKVQQKRWHSDRAPEWIQPALHKFWPEERPMSWDELITEMDEAMSIPGVVNAWTMPIKARIDMLSTGVRTPVGIKVFGPDLNEINKLGEHIEAVLRDVPGTRSAYSERTMGGLYLDIVPNRPEIARYGLNVEDVLMLVETAIGGMAIDKTVEGRERYTINVRYGRELRDDPEKLKRVLVPVNAPMNEMENGRNGEMEMSSGSPTPRLSGSTLAQIPLGQLVDIRTTSGPPLIKNEDGSLTGWVYVDVAGRDLGGYVRDAKKAVRDKIETAGILPSGYRFEWTGQYEYMLRVKERLKVVLPVTLIIIFVLLYMNFNSFAATAIIFLSIPFAITGSIWLLWLMDFNTSIAVWVGIIALAGLAAQTGTIMIVYLDEAFHAYQKAGKMKTQHDLFEAITYGAVQRVRPKLMTVSTTIMGLVPALWASGAGAEAIARIAAPMIGGLITSTILTLEIVPAIYSLWRGRQVEWVKGPRPPRKSWNELSHQFAEWEREQHKEYPEYAVGIPSTTAEQPKSSKRTWLIVLLLLIIAGLVAGVIYWQRSKANESQPAVAEHTEHVIAPEPESAPAEPPLPKLEVNEPQKAAVNMFFAAADAVTTSLSGDDIVKFNTAIEAVHPAITNLAAAFPPEHPWTAQIKLIQESSQLVSAGDLAEARKQFLPFSKATTDFARMARQQNDAFADLKIYRCSMAPKPGIWIQLKGPLQNPYYGEEMLECGNEIKK